MQLAVRYECSASWTNLLILATFCQKWRFEAADGGKLELKPVARLLLSPEKAPRVRVRNN